MSEHDLEILPGGHVHHLSTCRACKERRNLASEARHEALRLLREQFPLTYAELHEQAKARRGLKGGK